MIIKPKIVTKIPIEAGSISPDIFSEKSLTEINALEVYRGNKKKKLGDLFKVQKSRVGEGITLQGDFSNTKNIGSGMESGKITIRGNVGMHLGSQMRGGEIEVHGNVGDWAGAEMRGGLIRIKGNAGNLVGAAYRGSKHGTRGGLITVEKNAGHEVGELMLKGTIAVLGDMGSFAGAHMKGGTILCFGKMAERTGAYMNRGTIVAFNPIELLPTFRYNSTYNPTFLRFYLKELKKYGLPVRDEHITGLYDRHTGDIAELGKGEILIWKGK